MTTKRKFSHKLMSIFLCAALLISCLPIGVAAASRASYVTRVADAANADDWKDFFLPDDGTLSTENAGGIWTNKSVYTDASELGSNVSLTDSDGLLVALSAIASNMTIMGVSNTSTDTVLVLDVSGSMGAGYNNVAAELVDSANTSIATLLATAGNRVGVVLYSDSATTLLPLGRYKTTDSRGRFLSLSGSTISIDGDVTKEEGGRPYSGWYAPSRSVSGGTYIQSGIIEGMELFTQNNTADLKNRKPVMVLMTDGAPTYASSNFTDLNRNMGNGSNTSTAIGFVTQLTAAYAKQQIEKEYGASALFYTLGLAIGSNDSNDDAETAAAEKAVATSVLDPSNSSAAISKLWSDYNADTLAAGDSLLIAGNRYNGTYVEKAAGLAKDYVNSYFNSEAYTTPESGTLAEALKKAFAAIVADIELQSRYFPTLVQGDQDHSGYVTFNDKIGKYMKVTDIKGLRIGNTLFSGADLSSNFVEGGGKLGTYQNPTDLGDEMVWAVQQRIGLATPEQARALIGLAYNNGQLAYTNADSFSNYIGWYANAAGKYLGFWHEGITTMPDPSDTSLTDETRPAYIIKSYGYLGEVNAHVKSDMMYATVQVRENIATGEQTVIFAIPASLIPTITYEVTLKENGDIESLEATGAENPIQLVYEVGLDSAINQYTVNDKVSAEYLSVADNVNADGSVNFYSNQYEVDGSVGYGKVNTYSYFRPSHQNDRYYYQEDSAVYTDNVGTEYVGTAEPTGTVYHGYTVYKKDATGLKEETVYHETNSKIESAGGNSWYIPKGTVRRDYAGFVVNKATNVTGTLDISDAPFTDIYGHSISDTDHSFVFGATLGNNGRLTLKSESGVKISKTLSAGAPATDKPFEFVLTNTTNTADNTNYPAYKLLADGTGVDTAVKFTSGIASVQLKAGETLYIGGMIASDVINVKESTDTEYIVEKVNGAAATEANLTVVANEFQDAAFENKARGSGNLTISKEVEHPLGTEYTVPADKQFNIAVALTLDGKALANQSFNGGEVTTNGSGQVVVNGKTYITLAHGGQFEIMGVPAGTVAKVVEALDPIAHKGFAASYFDNGVPGDGEVEISADRTSSVIVVNNYTPNSISPNIIELTGTKNLTGRTPDEWLDTDIYEFELQRNDNGAWTTIGTAQQVNKSKKTFDFTAVIRAENYTEVGSYDYRVVEIEPAAPVAGVAYDKTVHAFEIIVTDNDMNGELEVSDVVAFRENNPQITGNATDGFKILTSFNNVYSANGNTNVALEIHKSIQNDSGSTLPKLSGFTFGLYKAGEAAPTYVSQQTTGTGTTRMIINDITDVGEYEFILKEIAPNPVPKGWEYSTDEINVTIKVEDNGLGVKSAKIYKTESGEAGATTLLNAGFTNKYSPQEATLKVDFVSKTLKNRALAGGEFKFEMRSYDPATTAESAVLEGTNDQSGRVVFNNNSELKFNKVGSYFYNVVETSSDGNGITTDKNTYRVLVTVSDIGGTLSAAHDVLNVENDTIEFVNTYTALPTSYPITASKTLESLSGTTERKLVNDEFIFNLVQVDDQGEELVGGTKLSAKNTADGKITFPAIDYAQAGTHYYAISEQETAGIYDIEFDKSTFIVTLTVLDDGIGNLSIGPISYSKGGANAPDGIIFNNIYKASDAVVKIFGHKTLEGRELVNGEFEFELYASDKNYTQGKLLDTVANTQNGNFEFECSFDKVGEYYFLVKELSKDAIGVTYDDTIYSVCVTVTDNLKGSLEAQALITDGDGIPQETVRFTNTYKAVNGGRLTVSGEKTLKGRDMADGEFTFELYGADDKFNINGNALKTATNKDGKFEFTVDYTAQDAGNTYYYVVKERNSGKTVDEVKYDSTQYCITVLVQDNLKGGIKTVMTITDGDKSVENIKFVNEYSKAPEAPPAVPTAPQEPAAPVETRAPKTGDTFNPALWFAVMFVSGSLLVTCYLRKKTAK